MCRSRPAGATAGTATARGAAAGAGGAGEEIIRPLPTRVAARPWLSRYRLYPTPAQETALLSHCTHARYVWNLAVEQRDWWQPGRRAPGYAEQCRQLSEARAAFPWLAEGSVIVQQ
jgi:putative transposase